MTDPVRGGGHNGMKATKARRIRAIRKGIDREMEYMTRIAIVLMVLLACASVQAEPMKPVPVSGLNYTDQRLNAFLFMDPNDSRNVAGGRSLRPFFTGGMVCCYRLPKQWRPGIQVKLRWEWGQGDDKSRQSQERIFEVPPYPRGRAGMLWAAFYGEDDVEVIASEYAPGNYEWPGRIKGWPQPTPEYRHKLWQKERDRRAEDFADWNQLVTNPTEADLERTWENSKQREPDQIRDFTGPTDPKFREFVRNKFKPIAEDKKKELEYWESREPLVPKEEEEEIPDERPGK